MTSKHLKFQKNYGGLLFISNPIVDVAVDQSGVSAPMVSVETASGVQHTFSHPDLHTHYCIDTREVRHSDVVIIIIIIVIIITSHIIIIRPHS